jgi:hypothetical protein
VRAATWLQDWNASYLRFVGASSAETGASAPLPATPAMELSCLRTVAPCAVTVPDGADLSIYQVPQSTLNACARNGITDLTINLGKTAFLSGKPFTLSSTTLGAAIKSVHVVGPADGTTSLTVKQPTCLAGAPCHDPVAAIALKGDISMDLRNVTMVPPPATGGGVTTPLARVALLAAGGAAGAANVTLRNVHIGNGQTSAFYKGVDLTGGTLTLVNSDVLAFTDAVVIQEGKLAAVSTAGTPNLVASLAQTDVFAAPSPVPYLKDLRGFSLAGNVRNFRGIALNAQSQAFLAEIRVSAPLTMAWADDQPGAKEPGITSWRTAFANDAGYFSDDSLFLDVAGRGDLVFDRVTVSKMGQVISCPFNASWTAATAPRIDFPDAPLFDNVVQDLTVGQGSCIVPILQ